MLDPLCGFCYRDNGTVVYDSSCIPVNETYTNLAAWGRSGSRWGGGVRLKIPGLTVCLHPDVPTRRRLQVVCSGPTTTVLRPTPGSSCWASSSTWPSLLQVQKSEPSEAFPPLLPFAHIHTYVSGMGTMPWTVNSEIYPLWARSTGNACSSGVNWIFNVLVSLTFLHVAEFLTYHGKAS